MIWFDRPADDWNTALPIGNGRLGGMVYGGVPEEHIQLNEDSVWYGGPRDRHNPDALRYLPELRQLIFDGKSAEAHDLASLALTGLPENQRHYEPLADLFLDFNHSDAVTDYRRELDIENAVVRVAYTADGVDYQREIFASAPDDVMVVRLTANAPFGVRGWLRRLGADEKYSHYLDTVRQHGDTAIILSGDTGGVDFRVMLNVFVEGATPSRIGEHLFVNGAQSVTFFVAAATSFYHDLPEMAVIERIERVLAQPYDSLVQDHIDDYRSLYDRVSLHFDGPSADDLPTDQRLERVKQGERDTGLDSLYFQFGRYLLIASSRPGTLPANLQGIWNDRWLPSWDSKYTININTEMNYWPAEVCNLSECHQPLFDLLERMHRNGQATARVMYGCGGFVAHHNTDIWADTAPQGHHLPSSYWPMGAAWLATHLWGHYLFTQNRDFLARAYPILRDAAAFFVDFLVEDSAGRMVTVPSVSPENTYVLPSGEQGTLCAGPSMDSQIIDALFGHVIDAADILGCDADLAATLRDLRERLPQPEIGQHGQLMEWADDYDEAEPGHRHISHLWALHPGHAITPETTPDLAQAAQVTLERRLAHGGGHTGWSRAWIINFWARLQRADEAYTNVQALLAQSTLPNLFDNHPPFQIDGNFGGTAGIAEMLLQSHAGTIHLLPALPDAWRSGSFRGLRTRGGFTVDADWQDGRITMLTLHASVDHTCRVHLSDGTVVTLDARAGASYPVV